MYWGMDAELWVKTRQDEIRRELQRARCGDRRESRLERWRLRLRPVRPYAGNTEV